MTLTTAPPRLQPAPSPTSLLGRLGATCARRARLVLVLTVLLSAAAAAAGAGVSGQLSGGGYTPPDSEAARAQEVLTARFAGGTPNMLLVAAAGNGGAGAALHRVLAEDPDITWVRSPWVEPDPTLRSADGASALVAVRLAGDEDRAQRAAPELVERLRGEFPGLDLRATGEAVVNAEVNAQSQRDLLLAELLGAPVVALLLLLVFRTPVAALLPLAVGAVSVVLTLAVLVVVSAVTPVSLFALNITTALGFGLAVDYSLFVVSRFREEKAAGADSVVAIARATATAGRTVLFSALTVALSLSALIAFPLYFLRSLAYAAIPVVLLGALASLVVLPALLRVTAPVLERGDVLRRWMGRAGVESPGWARLARSVMRRPLLFGLPVAAVLVLLAVPFADARFGLTDHRVLPTSAPAHAAAESVARDFPAAVRTTAQVTVSGADAASVDGYARELSLRDGTVAVQAPGAVWVDGSAVAPGDSGRVDGDTSWLTVVGGTDHYDSSAESLVRDVRAAPAPGAISVGGDTALLVDTKASLAERIPWAAGFIGLSTIVLLFLFTGSVVLPLKALLMNLLSLTASFGAMVFVFQQGHLQWLVGDFTPTGFLEVTVPVLMFCIAFGLSMDYEVFLLSRIREEHLAGVDNPTAVAAGLSRTGRLVSAAALVVAVVLLVLATSSLSLLKLLGVGLALAVLVDAVLVRGLLVPAFMRLAGSANWWAPAPLARLHRRVGLAEAYPLNGELGTSAAGTGNQPVEDDCHHDRHECPGEDIGGLKCAARQRHGGADPVCRGYQLDDDRDPQGCAAAQRPRGSQCRGQRGQDNLPQPHDQRYFMHAGHLEQIPVDPSGALSDRHRHRGQRHCDHHQDRDTAAVAQPDGSDDQRNHWRHAE